MTQEDREQNQPTADEVHAAWETNAAFWDGRFGEGNDFHLQLIAPETERLLAIESGERVLDVACGNGAFSRRMAALGARVVAFDFSAPFIELARKRTTKHPDRIDYYVIDATDCEAMLALGDGAFDAAVCTMGIMDMQEIAPLAEALPKLLTPGGRFVFSVMHPCFNNMGCRMSLEEEDREGEIHTIRSVKVERYLTPFAANGLGMIGQPIPQIYFHRPLGDLLRPFLASGFVLNGLEETAFDDPSGSPNPLSWDQFDEIPPVLIVRMRLGRPEN